MTGDPMDVPRSQAVIYRDARTVAKTVTLETLHWWRDSLDDELATAELRWSDVLDPEIRSSTIEYDVFAATERCRAVDDEISLRDRLAPHGPLSFREGRRRRSA